MNSNLADMLDLDEGPRRVLRVLLRSGPADIDSLSAALDLDVDAIQQILVELHDAGRIAVETETESETETETGASAGGPAMWRAVIGQRQARVMPGGIWDTLGDDSGAT
jgi:predicted ArsR family transcriptional regulator